MKRRPSMLTLMFTTMLCPSAGFAQSTPQEPSADSNAASSIEGEILVTARRRNESLKDVPISVTALSGTALTRAGVTDALSLQNAVPSLSLTTQGTSRNELGFSIRGQRTNEPTLLTDAPIGTYFAEVVQARSTGFANALFDIQSIQVLKGVQGTLFGRNMTGGAVLVEPNHPSDDLGAEVRGQYGNYDLRDLYGMVNIPVTDGVAVRVAGKTRQRDGFTKDAITGRDYDDQNYDAFRASLRLNPASSLESLTIFDWLRTDEHGTALIPTAIDPAAPGIAAYGVLRGFGFPVSNPEGDFARQRTLGKRRFIPSTGKGSTADAFGILPREKIKNVGVTNRTSLEVGPVTIKNIFGYRHVQFDQLADLDGSPASLVDANRFRNVRQYSEELQLQGKAFSDKLVYVAGIYYFRESGIDSSRSSQFPELSVIGSGLPPTTPAALFLTGFDGSGRAATIAGYAAGTYSLSDQFKISGGIRYTEDKRRGTVGSQFYNLGVCRISGPTGAPLPLADCEISNHKKWSAVTWDVAAQYEISDAVTTYVSTRRGFRAGGFTLLTATREGFEPFDPETVQEYELGLKSRSHIGRGTTITTNTALFYQDYKNVQKLVVIRNANGDLVNVIQNTAAQRNYGGEFEATLNSGPVDLSAFYSYVGVKIVKGRDPDEYQLVGAPHHQFGLSAAYHVKSSASVGDVTANASLAYRSKQRLDKNDVQGTEPGYALINLRTEWNAIAGSRLGAALFVNNLTNKYYRIGVIGIYKEAGYISSAYGEPRMYGVELSYKF